MNYNTGRNKKINSKIVSKEVSGYLANTSITCRSASYRRKSRFYQRANSLVSYFIGHPLDNYAFAFLNLSSSPQSKHPILDDFAILRKRIYRKYGKIWYIAVRELNERGDLTHIHAIIYAPYIPFEWLKEAWIKIHQAQDVFITAIYGSTRRLVSYVSKYISKTIDNDEISFARRYTVSQFFPNIGRVWTRFIKYHIHYTRTFNFKDLVKSWTVFMKTHDGSEIQKPEDIVNVIINYFEKETKSALYFILLDSS